MGMVLLNWPSHGGQPKVFQRMLQIPENGEILDFSANLNPLGPPFQMEEWIKDAISDLKSYPDPNYSELTETLARHEGIDPGKMLVTNGGAEAIFLVAQHFKGSKALVIQPTFAEYERACLMHNITVENEFLQGEAFDFPLKKVIQKMKDVQVVFLCRPNNPTGTVVKAEDIVQLLEAGERCGTTLVIDEAFIHFVPEDKKLTKMVNRFSNVILPRSLTKIYTLPGIRIGFVIAREEVINGLRKLQIPWSVNALAAAVVPRLIEKDSFITQTREWLKNELDWIKAELDSLNLIYSPTEANFYLLTDPDYESDDLFYFLAQNRIIARHTHNFKGLDGRYLRFAVRSPEENRYLIGILKQWRERK
jgi:threonine-phosphate decarboxylase